MFWKPKDIKQLTTLEYNQIMMRLEAIERVLIALSINRLTSPSGDDILK